MKKSFLRILSLLICVFMLLGIVGCGDNNSSSSEPDTSKSENSNSEQSSGTEVPQEGEKVKSTDVMYTFTDKTFNSAADFESSQIIAGLEKLGITSDYKIVIYQTNDVVVNTAAEVLVRFFAKAGISIDTVNSETVGDKQIILALNGTSDEQKALFEKNDIVTLKYSAKDDVSHVVKDGNNIIIAGSNGRGVLFGAYEFEDFVMYSESSDLNIIKTWDFRTRGQSLGFYWNPYENFRNTDITEERIEYLSRLGVNLFFPCFDGSGYECFFMTVVKSEIFPFQRDPDQDFINKVNKLISILTKYGIDYYHWITEPGLIGNMGGDLSQYPEGTTGTALLYGNEVQTLCVNNETVQKYYEEMMVKFIKAFPDCKGIILYNIDCNAYFCDVSLCENCKKAVSSTTTGGLAWENVSKMVTILADAADTVDTDFEVVFWPNIHHSGFELQQLIDNSHYDAIWGCWTGTDHDVIITKKTADSPLNDNVKRVLKASKDKNIPLYNGTIICRSECMPQGFCYPFSVAKQLKQMNTWEFTSSIESTGPTPSNNSVTALTMRSFWSDTSLDADEYVKYIMKVQFGTEAGEFMYQSALKTEEAMKVWDKYATFTHPMGGSKSIFNIGDILSYPQVLDKNVMNFSYYSGLSGDYIKDYAAFADLLSEAATLAKQAMFAAPRNQYVRYAYYQDADVGIVRPSCYEYAEMNYATAQFAAYVAQQRVHLMRANAYLSSIESQKARGEDYSKLLERYNNTLLDDYKLQSELLVFLNNQLSDPLTQAPTYFVTASFREAEVKDLINKTNAKLVSLNEQLTEAGIEH